MTTNRVSTLAARAVPLAVLFVLTSPAWCDRAFGNEAADSRWDGPVPIEWEKSRNVVYPSAVYGVARPVESYDDHPHRYRNFSPAPYRYQYYGGPYSFYCPERFWHDHRPYRGLDYEPYVDPFDYVDGYSLGPPWILRGGGRWREK